jgi:hypothetical protein
MHLTYNNMESILDPFDTIVYDAFNIILVTNFEIMVMIPTLIHIAINP